MGGIAGVEREAARRLGDMLQHQPAVEAHAAVGAIDRRAMGGQDIERLGVQDLEAEILQDPHRGVVDALELLGLDDLDGGEGIGDLAPGRLRHAGHGMPCRLGCLMRRGEARVAAPSTR